jgi:hypothetical protein
VKRGRVKCGRDVGEMWALWGSTRISPALRSTRRPKRPKPLFTVLTALPHSTHSHPQHTGLSLSQRTILTQYKTYLQHTALSAPNIYSTTHLRALETTVRGFSEVCGRRKMKSPTSSHQFSSNNYKPSLYTFEAHMIKRSPH